MRISDWSSDVCSSDLKLALLYPEGTISLEQAQNAVLNVARYNLFDLRDAMLSGHASKALNMLEGLRAEGVALLLVLWAVGEEIRVLTRLAAQKHAGQGIRERKRDV